MTSGPGLSESESDSSWVGSLHDPGSEPSRQPWETFMHEGMDHTAESPGRMDTETNTATAGGSSGSLEWIHGNPKPWPTEPATWPAADKSPAAEAGPPRAPKGIAARAVVDELVRLAVDKAAKEEGLTAGAVLLRTAFLGSSKKHKILALLKITSADITSSEVTGIGNVILKDRQTSMEEIVKSRPGIHVGESFLLPRKSDLVWSVTKRAAPGKVPEKTEKAQLAARLTEAVEAETRLPPPQGASKLSAADVSELKVPKLKEELGARTLKQCAEEGELATSGLAVWAWLALLNSGQKVLADAKKEDAQQTSPPPPPAPAEPAPVTPAAAQPAINQGLALANSPTPMELAPAVATDGGTIGAAGPQSEPGEGAGIDSAATEMDEAAGEGGQAPAAGGGAGQIQWAASPESAASKPPVEGTSGDGGSDTTTLSSDAVTPPSSSGGSADATDGKKRSRSTASSDSSSESSSVAAVTRHPQPREVRAKRALLIDQSLRGISKEFSDISACHKRIGEKMTGLLVEVTRKAPHLDKIPSLLIGAYDSGQLHRLWGAFRDGRQVGPSMDTWNFEMFINELNEARKGGSRSDHSALLENLAAQFAAEVVENIAKTMIAAAGVTGVGTIATEMESVTDMSGTNDMSAANDRVRDWMNSKERPYLAQYAVGLIDQGYENLGAFAELTESEAKEAASLVEMKPGHAVGFWKQCQELTVKTSSADSIWRCLSDAVVLQINGVSVRQRCARCSVD